MNSPRWRDGRGDAARAAGRGSEVRRSGRAGMPNGRVGNRGSVSRRSWTASGCELFGPACSEGWPSGSTLGGLIRLGDSTPGGRLALFYDWAAESSRYCGQ